MDRVMSFLGSNGYHAVSVDASGANIPSQHGPWFKFKFVGVDDPEAQTALEANGYYIFPNKSNA